MNYNIMVQVDSPSFEIIFFFFFLNTKFLVRFHYTCRRRRRHHRRRQSQPASKQIKWRPTTNVVLKNDNDDNVINIYARELSESLLVPFSDNSVTKLYV